MADNPLSLVSERWYIAAIAAGVALAGAALAAGHGGALCLGVGFVLVGVGEFVNTPRISVPTHVDGWGQVRQMVTGYVRRPNPFGIALDIIGVLMGGVGIVRIALF
ncbi:MAG: hypothetical protein KIT02_10450 [Devosia sp.]|uniref:hypothetical protein n=1 Tax=Devosia sp. TaxID=1871048 RepID=UPI0024C74C94|nr:hypothetical protein [Devosia sp.]UYN98386.1 MAG: hypothetical protein KIT02_10450 [Devosia sp.]